MSPFLFAQEMAAKTESKFNRLARISFEDESIFQHFEAGGYTGHDILIIGSQHTNDLRLELWIDMGVNGVPVAMTYQSDREVLLTPVYKASCFERNLTEEEIKEIFSFIFANPELIEIKKQSGQ